MSMSVKITEEIGKIIFTDQSEQTAVITISGEGSEMHGASVEFIPEIDGNSNSVAAHLAIQFMQFLSR